MKKVLALLLALALVFGLAACTETTPTTKPTEKATTAPTQKGADNKTEAAPTAEPLPWYVWDTEHPERYGGVVKGSYSDWSPSWDPMGQVSWTTHFWCMPVYQSILILGDDGNIYPQVCDYTMSEDGKTIKITIIEGKKFSDGTDVTTDDILASLKRASKLIANTNTYLWDILDHYEVEGRSITFYMKEYNASTMISIFGDEHNSNHAVMKKEICEKYGENLIYDPADTIGTGPYKFVPDECEIEQKAVFERNEYYKPNLDNPEGIGQGSPNYQYFDRVILMRLSGAETTFMAVQGDELDAFSSTNVDNFDTMLAPLGGYKMIQLNATGSYYCFFNCTVAPMSDPNLRKAITAAFDYMEVATTMYGRLAQRADSILVKGVYPEYYARDKYRDQEWYDTYGKELEKTGDAEKAKTAALAMAKKYLDKSCYNGEVLKLTGYQDSFMPALKFLDELGIKYTWTKLDNATLRGYAQDPTQQDKWDMVYRPNPLSLTPDGWTYTFSDPWGWGNEKVKPLLNALKTTPYNTEENLKYWDELNKEIVNDCPWCIIMVQPSCVVCKATLETRMTNPWYIYHMGYWTDPENHQN